MQRFTGKQIGVGLILLMVFVVSAFQAGGVDWVRLVINKPFADARTFGAKCDGTTNINSAMQSAIASGATTIFIPAGCMWIPPGGIIPGGANGITYYGGNWFTTVIQSAASPSGTLLQAEPGVQMYNVNLQGSGCTLIPHCESAFYSNGRTENDIIVTTGHTSSNFAVGNGNLDNAGSNWRTYGPGDGIFTDTFRDGVGARFYNETGSTGQAMMCGNNGGGAECMAFINPGGAANALKVYSDAGATLQATIKYEGSFVTNGHIATQGNLMALTNGANQNVPIVNTSFIKVTGPTAPFSIGGITNLDSVDGRLLTISNQTAQIMTINHEDSGSSALNRIFVPTAANYVCPHGFCVVQLIYDKAEGQWLLLGAN